MTSKTLDKSSFSELVEMKASWNDSRNNKGKKKSETVSRKTF